MVSSVGKSTLLSLAIKSNKNHARLDRRGIVRLLNVGGEAQPDPPQKTREKLYLRMGDKVRLRRGFHAGRLRGETPPRVRLGDIRGVAGDPFRRWLPAGCSHLGGRDSGITMRPYNCTHHTQVNASASIRWLINKRGFIYTLVQQLELE